MKNKKKIELREEIRNVLGTEKFYRTFDIEKIDTENRTVELSFSSEDPYERWWGIEILSHENGAIDFTRLKNSAPLLAEHNRDVQIGVVEDAWVENAKGRSKVRFSKNSEKGKEYFADVEDGIRKNVSVGYEILEMVLTSEKDGMETYTVTKWLPFEISMVSIPADQTVGVGRSKEEKNKNQNEEEKSMTEEEKKALRLKEQKAAREAEKARVREIGAIGSKYNMSELATKAIDDDKTVDQFRAEVLEKMDIAKPINSKSADADMPDEEIKAYSFSRAIAAAITGDWSKAQIEKKASDAVAKKMGKDSRGFFIPPQVLKRDLTTTTNGGSSIVQTTNGGASFIDMLREELLLAKLGGTVLSGMVGNVSIPKQNGATTAYWITEGGTTTKSDIGLTTLDLTPKTVSGKTAYSRQMLLQGNPDVESLVMRDLARTIALAIDKAAFSGSGASGEPLGLINTTGVNAIDCSNAAGGLDFVKVVDFETQVAIDNADADTMYYAAGASVTGILKTKAVENGQTEKLLMNGEVNGYKHKRSNQVGANTMIFGDFSQIITALWGGLDILLDQYSEADSGSVVIRAFQSVDVGVRQTGAFSISTNINQ